MDFFSRRRKKKNINIEPYDDDIDELLVMGLAMEIEGSSSNRRYEERCISINCNTLSGHDRLFNDYFSENPVYPPVTFRRRFRMSHNLFFRIHTAIEAHDAYFQQRRNATGKLGLSAIQKITTALRMLAYGVATDFVDEYVRIGETTTLESLKRFASAVVNVFGDEYLSSPTSDDLARLLAIGEACGFPGMIGSIDCMHWKWKNCPTAWKGSHNDINVLERSTVFQELTEGRAPPVNYSVNGNNYTMGYYLADGIYPSWATFVKTIPTPRTNKHKHFAMCQESVQKDVERAFGVLQARFAIVRGPAQFMGRETLHNIMMVCIVLHNMIVEDEMDSYVQVNINTYEESDESPPIAEVSHDETNEVLNFMHCHHRIRDREVHSQLQDDLINHLWSLHAEE